jgi:hypothetical protein
MASRQETRMIFSTNQDSEFHKECYHRPSNTVTEWGHTEKFRGVIEILDQQEVVESTEGMGPEKSFLGNPMKDDEDDCEIIDPHHHGNTDDDVSRSVDDLVDKPSSEREDPWKQSINAPSDTSTIPGLVSFRSGSFASNQANGGGGSSSGMLSEPTHHDSVSSLEGSHDHNQPAESLSASLWRYGSNPRDATSINDGMMGIVGILQPTARISDSSGHVTARWETTCGSKDAAPSCIRPKRDKPSTILKTESIH